MVALGADVLQRVLEQSGLLLQISLSELDVQSLSLRSRHASKYPGGRERERERERERLTEQKQSR